MTEIRPINDLIEALIDYRGKTPPKSGSGVPLITAKVIKEGRILSQPREYIDEKTYDTWMRRGLPRSGDILITTEAPLGEVAQVGRDAKIALAQRVILLRADPKAVDRQFLFHYLRSSDARARLLQRASGTTVSGIRQSELRTVTIPLLPRPAQETVGRILDYFDALIANNWRRVEVLEEMARAIYREWFLRFRFPGHEAATFVESVVGSVPEGWEVRRLDEVAEVNRASARPQSGEVVSYLDISALGERSIGRLVSFDGADVPGRARRLVSPGDVVWSTVRPNRRAHALLVNPGKDWIVSTGIAVLTPTSVSSDLLFETVSTREFSDYLVSKESGAAYPAVKPGDFATAPFLVPPEKLDREFAAAVGPNHQLVWTLGQASERLRELRDLLLPRLVTGQIDVSSLDLDALAEDSVV
jgi:type I restriction enzyme S subunit